MKNIDSVSHLRGESNYIDDLPEQIGTLYAVPYGSPYAHAKIKKIHLDDARLVPGVVAIFTAKDIPGENQIGGIIPDEVLMADGVVDFVGMPVAVVIAKTEHAARVARSKISMDTEELPIITSARVAKEKSHFLVPPRTFSIGDSSKAFIECDHVFEGVAAFGGQEHVYLETQAAYAYPLESGFYKIHSSTQSPTAVQKTAAKVLGLSMHHIEVDVIRLGGGFGGKEDQANTWSALAVIASYHLKKPVKLVLHRGDDMRMTGKRHPYDFDFKIGLDQNLKIKAYEVICYQNGGAAADLSPAIMERTLFHGGSSYFIPNGKTTVYSCRTNLPPNTAFRGFGAPQAMFALESAITFAADKLGVARELIQEKNLLSEGDLFPYGQIAKGCKARSAFDLAVNKFDFKKQKMEVVEFNKKNSAFKKGISIFPLCFGISFTKTMLNQAAALVHIYNDGSVSINTGVIEMGQGVNTKLVQVASSILGIPTEKINVTSTNTTRVANASPTAASSGADLNGHATRLACERLKVRLDQVSKDEKITDWKALIWKCYEKRISLTEQAFYATPTIHFDKEKEMGWPFAYHVYGTAITTVTVDCIRGTYKINAVDIVHDFGKSMNLDLDIGQVEGALAQGIGLMTIEEQTFNEKGKNMTDSLSMYKIPDIYFTPERVTVLPHPEDANNLAIMGSKAVGEPPLMYGLGAYFAIHEAVQAFNKRTDYELRSPYTHERCMMNLYKRS